MMFRYLAKRSIDWYWDNQSNRLSADPLPSWLRHWVDRDGKLREYEKTLIQLTTRLEGASEQHRLQSFANSPSDYEPFYDAVRSSRASSRGTSSSSSSTVHATRWPLWKLATLGIVVVALLAGGLTLRDVLMGPDTSRLSKNEPTIPSSRDTRALVQSSYAMSHRWSSRLKATKSQMEQGMQKGVADLDTQIIDEAQSLGRQGVRFVTQDVPASAVRMFIRTRTIEP